MLSSDQGKLQYKNGTQEILLGPVQIATLTTFLVYMNVYNSNSKLLFREHLKGRCEVYTGEACQEYLEDQSFYIESFENQETKEGNIKAALDGLGNIGNAVKPLKYY